MPTLRKKPPKALVNITLTEPLNAMPIPRIKPPKALVNKLLS
jgi:hypothetical protein